MNKQQKEYTCSRLGKIAREANRQLGDTDSPCETKFIHAAVVGKTAKLKSANEILGIALSKAVKGCRYGEVELKLGEIIKTPSDYGKAVKEWEAEKKQNASSREKIEVHLQKVKDQIWLDHHKRGTEVISQFEEFIKGVLKKAK